MPHRVAVRYLVLLLATAAVCAPLRFFGSWGHSVMGCRTLDRPHAFLAYCDTPAFGSYEHEAYAFALEPEAVAAARGASVLFLGNSRLQVAFSTPQVDGFFRSRGVSYHLLGFGYGESSLFPRRLLDRLRPRPRVLIVNADPFFAETLSAPGYDIARAPWAARADGWMKRGFGALHLPLCRAAGGCAESAGATYRDTETGQWIWQDVLVPRATVAGGIGAAKATAWSAADLPAWRRNAERFLAPLGVPRGCVILTGVPSPAVDAEGMAAALGGALDAPAVLPPLADLTASDNSHLSAESAERWSAAFLAAAGPTIEACLR